MANINFEGKSLLITGGSTGLGEGMVDAFDKAGARGVILDKAFPKNIRGNWHFIRCDLTNEKAVRDAFAAIPADFKPLDFLIANAGIVPSWSSIPEISLEVWDQVMAVNARGLLLTLKYGFDLLRKSDGAVVVTASINSWKGDGNIVSYVASKHAALGIVRSAALDFGKFGIRVNAIAPGPITTSALISRIEERSANTQLSIDQELERLKAQTALGRLASIEDVANVALFLCSELSHGMTGQIINVDAGLL